MLVLFNIYSNQKLSFWNVPLLHPHWLTWSFHLVPMTLNADDSWIYSLTANTDTQLLFMTRGQHKYHIAKTELLTSPPKPFTPHLNNIFLHTQVKNPGVTHDHSCHIQSSNKYSFGPTLKISSIFSFSSPPVTTWAHVTVISCLDYQTRCLIVVPNPFSLYSQHWSHCDSFEILKSHSVVPLLKKTPTASHPRVKARALHHLVPRLPL